MTSFYVPPMQSFPTMWVLVLAGFFYFCVYKWALGPSFVFSEILKVSFCCVNLVPIWKFLNWKFAQPHMPPDLLKIVSCQTLSHKACVMCHKNFQQTGFEGCCLALPVVGWASTVLRQLVSCPQCCPCLQCCGQQARVSMQYSSIGIDYPNLFKMLDSTGIWPIFCGKWFFW